MSISSSGGFTGDNALLAFAAVQQSRMNGELSEAMRVADVRSRAAKEISDIKAHLSQANKSNPDGIAQVKDELDAFMAEFGDDPACADLVSAVTPMKDDISLRVNNNIHDNEEHTRGYWQSQSDGTGSKDEKLEPIHIVAYQQSELDDWFNNIQETLDAAGQNDQLAMVHMKQLNDNINNSSGMVSGMIESHQNVMAQIINNIA